MLAVRHGPCGHGPEFEGFSAAGRSRSRFLLIKNGGVLSPLRPRFLRIWHTIFITFNHAATIDLPILFSLHMRHLSKEKVACARLIIAFFFLYGEIEMKVPPMILTNPLLPHKSFQFMCMILKQKKINKASYQYEKN